MATANLALLKEMNRVLEIDLRDDSHYDGNRLVLINPGHRLEQHTSRRAMSIKKRLIV